MPENVLEVRGLRRTFGAVHAVDDVSFALPEGGSLGVVGESGSGKTTTARIVVGLERADEGEVLVRGRGRPGRGPPGGRGARPAPAPAGHNVFQAPQHTHDPPPPG
ncbi:ATP-binding cassette domain-containing protein, partial [Streptomyces yangpuensis]|uniref:ATP-binding cassette domain-containing protein n=1 Tax=Streptomyces yangpuensis TaxID=1648182 RepID=UPI00368DCC01